MTEPKRVFHGPVIVTDCPKDAKALCMRLGEIIGGSPCEDRAHTQPVEATPAVLVGFTMVTSVDRVILFCDCHDFSRLQLVLPGPLFEFMDAFYRVCGECVVAAGGRIVKYIGDGILAVFPEDAADRAVAAATCMRKEHAALVSAQQTNVDSDLEVGISFGQVEEGIVGHATLRSFDLFGECVNEAAMIGHHRGIAVTDAVRVRLSKETAIQPLKPYHPKWRENPLTVWEVG